MLTSLPIPSKRLSTGLAGLVFAASWIHPLWPQEQALHSASTLAVALYLWFHLRRHPMADSHFLLICLFLTVHNIAAHWLYSNVPYDQWAKSLTGYSLNETFGWRRNHTDRLIHLLYGLCCTPAMVHHLARRYSTSLSNGFKLTVLLIMATSLVYEWLEWLIAITMSPEDAEAYNGQQGDMWDAHKDMLIATIGALVWWGKYRNAGPLS